MKSLSFLLVLLFPLALLADDSAIEKVFVHQAGKNNLYVLQLKEGNSYDYMRYTNNRMYHDFGIYSLRHGKIAFESHNRKHGFNSVGGKTYFVSKKGIFKTRMQSLLGKHSVLQITQEPIYMSSWDFNPITGKTAAEESREKAEKVKSKKTPAQRNAELVAFTKAFYFSEVNDYAAEYKPLLESNYCGPNCYTSLVNNTSVPWDYDTTRTSLVNDFGTVVHESTHEFNGAAYLVIPGIAITVEPTATFHSSEFKKIVPADAAAKLFRYNTYVGDSAVVSSNTSGIYGLLDEFSAYENGTRADVLAAKTALEKGDTALAKNFLSQAEGTYFAYYEFNLFMAWYLHYAKTNQPEIYKSTMANTNLRLAYTLIDQQFAATIDELKETGAAAGEGKDFLSNSESLYAAYPKQLLVKERSYLTAFSVKGANSGNYLAYEK